MKDIEIARTIKLEHISNIAKKIGLNDENLEFYGKYKAKIDLKNKNLNSNSKIVLVTAVSPTPLGEGKTTVAIRIS